MKRRAGQGDREALWSLGRGLQILTLELNLSNIRTHSRVNLGHTVGKRAQVEL